MALTMIKSGPKLNNMIRRVTQPLPKKDVEKSNSSHDDNISQNKVCELQQDKTIEPPTHKNHPAFLGLPAVNL